MLCGLLVSGKWVVALDRQSRPADDGRAGPAPVRLGLGVAVPRAVSSHVGGRGLAAVEARQYLLHLLQQPRLHNRTSTALVSPVLAHHLAKP